MRVPFVKLTVSSTRFCQVITSKILIEECSTGFTVEPLPDDCWEIMFKKEHEKKVKEMVCMCESSRDWSVFEEVQ